MTLASLTYRLVDLWMKKFSSVRFVGPILADSPDYERVMKFRADQNRLRAPYLEDDVQLEIERRLRLDERSLHFVLERSGEIAASVRVTPPPFEFSALSPILENRAEEFAGYYEFGRLCTDVALGRKAIYAGLLVIKAAQHVFLHEMASGIVGVCRAERVSYMKKLGLNVDGEPAFVPSRQAAYRVIHGSKDHLIAFYYDFFLKLFSRARTSKDSAAEVSHESRPA
ncbi:MAG: hypothetical protein JST04_18220 [Bdellovibrionales bacterium]|nr:hypothetical protein [Bdellovibrionales bacterium]